MLDAVDSQHEDRGAGMALGWRVLGGVFMLLCFVCAGSGPQPHQERKGMAESKRQWDEEMKQAARQAKKDLLFAVFIFICCRLLFLGCLSQNPRTKESAWLPCLFSFVVDCCSLSLTKSQDKRIRTPSRSPPPPWRRPRSPSESPDCNTAPHILIKTQVKKKAKKMPRPTN